MAVSIERFVECLSATGIMTEVEAAALVKSLPPGSRTADADELARDLVRLGKITRYQAAAIYQDKTDGLLLGNYLILDKIGAGGMGQVFRARHRRMDRVVALKVLSKKALGSADAIARFQREGRAAAKLTHANIVTAYDADEAGGMHFLVMEYVEGSDLASVVKRDGPMPPQRAVDYVLQAARGLEHAHAEGIIHRDIKPSNLLLDKRGTVKILDMGLARIADSLGDPKTPAPGADLTQSGTIMGTVDFMAPEQAMDSRQADARSDIYSLGCTFYYLLTGRAPYGGDTTMKRLMAHQQAAIPLVSSTRADTPAGVQDVFRRMVAKPPAARFQTMKEAIAALDSCLKDPAPVPVLTKTATRPTNSAEVSPSEGGLSLGNAIPLASTGGRRRRSKKTSKTPVVIAATVLVLGAAGAAAFGFKLFTNNASQQADSRPASGRDENSVVAEKPDREESSPISPPKPPVSQSEMPEASQPPTVPLKSAPSATADARGPPSGNVVAAESPPVVMPGPTVTSPGSSSDRPASESLEKKPATKPAATKAPLTVVGQADSPPTKSPSASAVVPPPPGTTETKVDTRLPVPNSTAQDEAKKLIQDVFIAEATQSKQPEAKIALAEKLLKQADQSRDDPVASYVMIHEAVNLAADAGDVRLMELAVNALVSHYQVESWPTLAAGAERILAKTPAPGAVVEVVEAAMQWADEAAASDHHADAKRFVEIAAAAARRVKDPQLQKLVADVGKSVAAAKQQWEAKEKALAKLTDNPDDGAANQSVGRFLCFVRGDWEHGLPYLAKCNDPTLSELAAKSLEQPGDANGDMALADRWWAAAEKVRGKGKFEWKKAARHWYEKAQPGLSGLNKTRVEARLREIESAESPVTSSPRRLISRIAANGLALSATFDCTKTAEKVPFNEAFNIQTNWLLALKFSTAAWEGGSHMMLHCGDGRLGHDSLWLALHRERLEVGIGDSGADKQFRLSSQLTPQDVGRWVDVVVRYNALRSELSLYVDDKLVASEKSTVVPAVDRPMPMWIGGEHEDAQRFHGQVREVWLGNLQ